MEKDSGSLKKTRDLEEDPAAVLDLDLGLVADLDPEVGPGLAVGPDPVAGPSPGPDLRTGLSPGIGPSPEAGPNHMTEVTQRKMGTRTDPNQGTDLSPGIDLGTGLGPDLTQNLNPVQDLVPNLAMIEKNNNKIHYYSQQLEKRLKLASI